MKTYGIKMYLVNNNEMMLNYDIPSVKLKELTEEIKAAENLSGVKKLEVFMFDDVHKNKILMHEWVRTTEKE